MYIFPNMKTMYMFTAYTLFSVVQKYGKLNSWKASNDLLYRKKTIEWHALYVVKGFDVVATDD